MKLLYSVILYILILVNSVVNANTSISFITQAKQAILIDAINGQILFEYNSNELMPPSSMTKIMTTYLAFEALKNNTLNLTDQFTTSAKAWKMQGSKMFLNYGDTVSVDNLLKGIIVQSGNDACIVLAEGMYGDESIFVQKMNLKAVELGMMQTNFLNTSGWPDLQHLTTAKDLSKLAIALISDFPEYYNYHQISQFTYGNIIQHNRNTLLGKMGVDGIKTGHTEAGGYGIVLSAVNKGKQLIAVINGLSSDKMRSQEGEKILNYGFNAFNYFNITTPQDILYKTTVQYGVKPLVGMTVKDNFVILANSDNKKISCILEYQATVKAPIYQGDRLGVLKCEIPNIFTETLEVEVIAAEDVQKANFIQKLWHNINLLI